MNEKIEEIEFLLDDAKRELAAENYGRAADFAQIAADAIRVLVHQPARGE